MYQKATGRSKSSICLSHGKKGISIMKTAFVSGSAKRLGKEIALRLAQKGYFVWMHYHHSHAEAEETLQLIKQNNGDGNIISGDISKHQDVIDMALTVKKTSHTIDVLINNVGIYKIGNLLHYHVNDFEETIQTNLVGSYYMIDRFLPLFPLSGGSIINIGYSGVEYLTASINNTAYTISKTGLLILTRSYAHALGSRNIRVNMVSPGQLSNSVDLSENVKQIIPLGRFGECHDIVHTVEFLLSDNASYITGVNIDIAGGYMMRLAQ